MKISTSNDYPEFEALKESLAADADGAMASGFTDDGADDDAYTDFMRFVMRRQALAQPA